MANMDEMSGWTTQRKLLAIGGLVAVWLAVIGVGALVATASVLALSDGLTRGRFHRRNSG